ncbi:hypothetical protein POSPLADRAFT_1032989 [Postia placenta MAD-698-R-SB12]|uniref:Uncharacterized protein n=1 Tax=Postia placenta MAD-698-R-SB12 TaxID=670580 RepID=A0A1X6N4G4_9APHY|nr:hypothetical protein POSPLADRAFT_1032989 [Postia placenta MAD-698-R-SB12]OSX63323.1 hypothetical protein POSPLADRAFT_1032989 [Postia placenta MAD-698-R-SB12]
MMVFACKLRLNETTACITTTHKYMWEEVHREPSQEAQSTAFSIASRRAWLCIVQYKKATILRIHEYKTAKRRVVRNIQLNDGIEWANWRSNRAESFMGARTSRLVDSDMMYLGQAVDAKGIQVTDRGEEDTDGPETDRSGSRWDEYV